MKTATAGCGAGMGLALGGGIGYLLRSHGLTADSIINATIVISNGTIVIILSPRMPDCIKLYLRMLHQCFSSSVILPSEPTCSDPCSDHCLAVLLHVIGKGS